MELCTSVLKPKQISLQNADHIKIVRRKQFIILLKEISVVIIIIIIIIWMLC
jgi:hypothetical protein